MLNAKRKELPPNVKNVELPKTAYFAVNKLCAWRHNMPPPPEVDNIYVFIVQVAPVPACWIFKTSTTN